VPVPTLAAKRPAELSGVAGAAAILIAALAGVTDPTLIAALGILVGAIPAAVTGLVVLLRRRKGSA
jgi:hypothetical protein